MDSQRFDFLVRQWVNSAPRRRVLAALAVSALAALGAGEETAAKKKHRRRCPSEPTPASCDVDCTQEGIVCNPDTGACDIALAPGGYRCLCQAPKCRKDWEPDPDRGCTACAAGDCGGNPKFCVCICRKKDDHNLTESVNSDCKLTWVPS